MIEIQGWNQIPMIQSNFIQIQSAKPNSIFIRNLFTFGQSINNQSCAKCPSLSTGKNSDFF
jgi:hypothetical protein